MSRWRCGLPLMGVGLALQACSPELSSGPIAEVVDSAGYRIVTYDLSSADPSVFRVVKPHDLQIGALQGSGEYAFAGLVDLAVVERGWLLVSDAGAPELRMFDSAGAYQGTIGRRGEGPGEFGSPPTIAGILADTVFAFDRRLGRVTGFLLSGGLLATTPIHSREGGPIMSALRLRDGSYVGVSQWVAPDSRVEFHDVRLVLDSVVVERLDPEGQVVDTMRLLPGRRVLRLVQDGGARGVRMLQAEPPFMPREFVESNGRLVVTGHSSSFELEIEAPSGERTLLRVLGAENPADHNALQTSQEAKLRQEFGDPPWEPGIRRYELDNLPDRLPAFAAVLLGPDGDIWVARSEIDDSNGNDWLVFSPDGSLRGSVHTPTGVRLLAIGGTFVVGVVTDDLDVPYVRRYPLVASTPN